MTELFDTGSTEVILRDAARARESKHTPTVMADAGVENCNQEIDGLVECGLIRRVIALTELCFSNSTIEAKCSRETI